jgi:VanZ family protein
MKPFLKYYLPALLWAALIFTLSSIPRHALPPVGFRLSDKIYHFIEFAILGLLLIRAFRHLWPPTRQQSAIFWAALSGTLWGVLDEVHQNFVRGRDPSLLDALADTAGVVFVAVVVWWWFRP